MKRLVNVQKVIDKTEGILTPTTTRILEGIKSEAGKYKVMWNGSDKYQVSGPWSDQCTVDVAQKVCTCRKWELSGIPCKHAVATIWNMAKNGQTVEIPEYWVHPTYHLDTWKTMYSFKIVPVDGRLMWPKCNCPTILTPPDHHAQVGRPRKKRKKSVEEMGHSVVKGNKMARIGSTVTCNKCKTKGHNSRTCTGH